jgi:hypothetical protein
MAGATGSSQGSGTINATNLYINGVAVNAGIQSSATATGTVSQSGCSGTSTNTMQFNKAGNLVTVRIPSISCNTTGSPTLQGFTINLTYPSGYAPSVAQSFPILTQVNSVNQPGQLNVNTSTMQVFPLPYATMTGVAATGPVSGPTSVTVTYTLN